MELIYTGVNVEQLTSRHPHRNHRHGLVVFLAELAGDHAEVNLGGLDTGVAEQGLDVADVCSASQHGDGDAVAQQMRLDPARQPSTDGQVRQEVLHHERANALATVVQEQRAANRANDETFAARVDGYHSERLGYHRDRLG